MMGKTGRIWLAAAAASLAFGCGGEESQPAAGGGVSAPEAPAQDPALVLQDMYEWDASRGAPRDLATDSAKCQAESSGQGLAGVAQHIQCMQQKGWKTRQPAS